MNGLAATRSSKLQYDNCDNRRLTCTKRMPSLCQKDIGYSDDSGDSDEFNKEKRTLNTGCQRKHNLLGSSGLPKVVASKMLVGQSSSHSFAEQSTASFSCKRADVGSMQCPRNVSMSAQGVFENSLQANDPIDQTVQIESTNGSTAFQRKPQAKREAGLPDDNISKTFPQTNRLAPPKLNFCLKLYSQVFGNKGNRCESTLFFQSENSSPKAWSLHCSKLLPVLTAVFFVLLGLLYVSMGSDDITSNFTFSSLDLKSHEVKDVENETFIVVNHIYNILATTAGNALCNVSNGDARLHIDPLKLELKVGKLQLSKALGLIRNHPEWGIFLYIDELGTHLENEDNLSTVLFLETKHPILPTLCRLQRAATKVMYRLAIILLALFVMWLMLLCRRYMQRKEEERRQKMFAMVDKILDVLKNHYVTTCIDDKVEPFIPILRVRDMVVPPNLRRSKTKEWEQAVHFISVNEFHVKVETQSIGGEDCRVWRWTQVALPSKNDQAPSRVWKGGALVTNPSKNIPNICPTPCLKIRNMFDPALEKDVDWQLQIQESILEKCSNNNEILSVVVEKKSKEGVVYLKCSSCLAAGKAFQSLQGSWFDCRLVTVKFIKLQRFHTRFPHTVDLKTPLKSNSKDQVVTFHSSELNSSGLLTPDSFISDF